MDYEDEFGCHWRQRSGITPLFSNLSFFMVGSSVSCIYTLATLVTMGYAEYIGLNLELNNHCYRARQFVLIFAMLGIVIGLALGMGGKMTYMVAQWLLCGCYFVAAGFVRSYYIDLHLRVKTMLWFAALAAVLSGIAQTSAVYCITHSSMPGGYGRLTTRVISFFLGCSVSGLNFSSFYAVRGALRVPSNAMDILQNQYKTATSIAILCTLAGIVSLVAAGSTSYLLVWYECKSSIDDVSWFPFFTTSRYDITAASIRKQVNSIYMPLLWTSNPLFVVFAISITFDSPASMKQVFGQYLVYAVAAFFPIIIFGSGGGFGFSALAKYMTAYGTGFMRQQSIRREVSKTQDIYLTCEYYKEAQADVASVVESGGSVGTRPTPGFPEMILQVTQEYSHPQWSLLKGVVWSHWQKRDAVYRLCSEALSTLHSTLLDLQCLELNEFYDNFTVIMEQYRSYISSCGMFMDLPFSIEDATHPMLLFREMIKHQQHVLLIQMKRVGSTYANMLRDKIQNNCCAVMKKYKTAHLCCETLLASVLSRRQDYEPKTEKPLCKCCFVAQQMDVKHFMKRSVDAVSERCESLTRTLFQNIGFKKPISNPDNHSLYIEKKLLCYLRTHCESTILLVNILLVVEELLLIQEWLCVLCKYTSMIHERVSKRKPCKCNLRRGMQISEQEKEMRDCPWICIDLLLDNICSLLVRLHNHKLKLLRRIRAVSISAPDEIEDEVMRTDIYAANGLIDTVRTLVIIVIAVLDLLNLDECLKSKLGNYVLPKENKNPGGCSGAYHLLLPSLQYLKKVIETFLKTEGGVFRCSMLEELVIWYSGLVTTISKLCPEIDMDPTYSYDALKNLDKEVVVPEDKGNTLFGNMDLAAKIYFSSNMSLILGRPWLAVRDQAYKVSSWCNQANATYGHDCSDPKTTCTIACNKDGKVCSCKNNPKICSHNPKDVEDHICAVFRTVDKMLGCEEKSTNLKCCAKEIQEKLKECTEKFKELCGTGDTAPTCNTDCCKDSKDVYRFSKLVKQFIETAGNHTNVACSPSSGSTCPCCTATNNKLGTAQLTPTLLNIMKCIFCCKQCVDITPNCNISCILAEVFCCVYQKLCDKSKQQDNCCNGNCICPTCCSKSPGGPCTCNCTPPQNCTCTHQASQQDCCNGGQATSKPTCRSLNCWVTWFRCYVLCGKNCNAAAGASPAPAVTCQTGCGTCRKDCSTSDCQCKTQADSKCGDCQCCHFSRLSKSLFFCSTCNTNGQTATQDSSSCTKTITCDCNCEKDCKSHEDIKITQGSKTEIKKDCCSHRLGCSLQIITKDLESLKQNACSLKDRVSTLCSNADTLKDEVTKFNQCLTDFYGVLCYAQYGICHMIEWLCKIKNIAENIDTQFPCFEKEMKDMAEKDINMVGKVRNLLNRCWLVAQGGLLLIQRFIWTFTTIYTQKLRAKHINKDLNHVKGDQNKNWTSLMNLKGGKTWAHGAMCPVVDFGALGGGRLTALGCKSAENTATTEIVFKPDLDPDVFSFSVLGVLKYIWVLLSFYVLLMFVLRRVFYSAKPGSAILLTMLTALSAFHLTMAVKGFGFQTITPKKNEAKSIGTYINTIMLTGLAIIFAISWVANICTTYTLMRSSLNHVTERLRTVGIYDTDTANGLRLLLQTVSAAWRADVRSLISLCNMNEMIRMELISDFQRVFETLTLSGDSHEKLTAIGLSEEFRVRGFLSKVQRYSFLSVNWVFDAVAFSYLYPKHYKFLNRLTTYQSQFDKALPLLWSAWTKNTVLTDVSMRVCQFIKEALLKLNADFLTNVEDVQNIGKQVTLGLVWNSFYESQYTRLPDLCLSNELVTQIYTESQITFLRDVFAGSFVEKWEQFHTGLYEYVRSTLKGSIRTSSMDQQEQEKAPVTPSESLEWLAVTGYRQELIENYMYSFSRSGGLEGTRPKASLGTATELSYEKVVDVSLLREKARVWMKAKKEFCREAGEGEKDCTNIVDHVMSKLEEFIKSGIFGHNFLEEFHQFAMKHSGPKLDDPPIAHIRNLHISTMAAYQNVLVTEKMSLLSSLQQSKKPDAVNSVSYKYRHDIRELLENDKEEDGWMTVLYWLGTWSIFNSMPISQRDVSYLLM